MSDVRYVVTDLPPIWPGKRTKARRRAPFKTSWTRTMDLLGRELRHLGATSVEMALDLPRGAMDLRQDGMLKSDARPGPSVILSFIDREGQRQAYPCDTFAWWQDNLYAIAVVLEDLRRAERYGVQSALLRAGFKALPSSTEQSEAMTAERAAELLARYCPFPVKLILNEPSVLVEAAKMAKRKAHPDSGGSGEDFDAVQRAIDLLEKTQATSRERATP